MRKFSKISFLISILFLSCGKDKNDDLIEIYLTNKKIQSYDGVSIKNSFQDSIKQKEIFKRFGNGIRIDTINKKIIFAGKFHIKNEDIEKEPFITDSEIIGINFKSSEIYFKKSVASKIYKSLKNWRKKYKYGRQFVLKYNGKKVLNGYFIPMISSQLSNTYQILYYPAHEKKQNDTLNGVNYLFFDGLNFDENYLIKNKLLKDAFNNRLIKK